MSRQLIKLKTVQNMIKDTPNSNFSSQLKYKHAIGIGKLEKGV